MWYTAYVRRLLPVFIYLALLIQACSAMPFHRIGTLPTQAVVLAQASPAAGKTATLAPLITTAPPATATLIPTGTSSPSPVPPSPTLALAACLRAGGRVQVNSITTDLLPDPLIYRIYLPPCYDEQPERSYPVLYLVHGMYNDDSQWDRVGVPDTANQLISNGEVPPFIVVMPRDRVWVEPSGDNFGKAVAQALVPWIDAHYRTISDRAHRAIGGLSRGAAWAVDIGLSRSDLFSRVGVHSGFVFTTDLVQISLWVKNTPQALLPNMYVDLGDRDGPEVSQGSAWLEDFLTQHDIPHEWHLFLGEHEEAYWQAHVEDYLRWYALEW